MPQDDQPIQYGPTRATLTLFEYDPPVVFMIDINNVAVATGGISETLFESLREALASALGPYAQIPTQGTQRHPSEDAPGRNKEKGKPAKGKGKDKAKKGKKDRPATPESADTPDEAEDEIPVEPLPDVIDPETLEPVEGDVDVREPQYEPVTVNTTAEIVPALFEQWYAENYPNSDSFPAPADHPELVREYLNDPSTPKD